MARRALILTLIAAGCGAAPAEKSEDSDTDTVVDTFPEEDTDDTDDGGGGGNNGGNNVVIGPDTDTDEPELPCTAPSDDKLASACDFSVNNGLASVRTAGGPLVLEVTSNNTPLPGSFNAASRDGNLALAGFHGFSLQPLETRSTVSLLAKHASADSLRLEVRLVVDLNCNTANLVQLILDTANMTQTPAEDGYISYSADASSPAWFAAGRINGTDGVLLWGHSDTVAAGAEAKALTDLLTAHPKACLRNANNASFRDMPLGDVISSSLLSLGASLDARATSRWEVSEVRFGDATFSK